MNLKKNVCVCVSSPPDILVPAGRFGAQVPEPDLLHAGVHRTAVSMCQPLLSQRQVEVAAAAAAVVAVSRTNQGTHGLVGGEKCT